MKKAVALAILVVFSFSLLSAAPAKKTDIKYGAYVAPFNSQDSGLAANTTETGLLVNFNDALDVQFAFASFGKDYFTLDADSGSAMALTLTYYIGQLKTWDAGLTLRYQTVAYGSDSQNDMLLGGSIKREIADWIGVKIDAFLLHSKSGVDMTNPANDYKGSGVLAIQETRIALYTMF